MNKYIAGHNGLVGSNLYNRLNAQSIVMNKNELNLLNQKEVNEFFEPARCLVFSDDIEWCKQTFGDKFSYSENNSNVEDMCDDNIITNGSFSWWGSWLNEHIDKRIVAPSSWFGPKGPQKHEDIYTKDMIKA